MKILTNTIFHMKRTLWYYRDCLHSQENEEGWSFSKNSDIEIYPFNYEYIKYIRFTRRRRRTKKK